jgi:hypothetical protein
MEAEDAAPARSAATVIRRQARSVRARGLEEPRRRPRHMRMIAAGSGREPAEEQGESRNDFFAWNFRRIRLACAALVYGGISQYIDISDLSGVSQFGHRPLAR